MTLLFALTLFLSAALLFAVEPMVARMILPYWGGSPAVWTTCLVFYQAALLGGYLYAHALTRKLGPRGQVVVHAGFLLAALLFIPIAIKPDANPPLQTGMHPAWSLIGLLVAAVGVPFFVLAATAPLLQRWFANTRDPSAADPYFLYSASNAGSLLALAAYPILIEPNLRLAEQARLWAIGYLILAGLTMACGAAAWSSPGLAGGREPASPRPGARLWLWWVALAFIPSSWMLGVTTYLTTDLAPVPLLWVVPLALYLLTFVIAFARRPIVPPARAVALLPWLVVPWAVVVGFGLVQPFLMVLHLAVFFVGALACHGELARRRPPVGELTAFYLALAVGGVLGGAFNALLAPQVFDRVAEYPLAVVAACLLLGLSGRSEPLGRVRNLAVPVVIFALIAALAKDVQGVAETALGAFGTMLACGLVMYVSLTHRRNPVRFALGIGAALLASGFSNGVDGRVLLRSRSFFGVTRVTEVEPGPFHRLYHGTTLHGQQCFEASQRGEPLTYFHRSGPAGDVFAMLSARSSKANVAVVGLGAGSLAAYAESEQCWKFYEIDRTVTAIASDLRYFTYLHDCRARELRIVEGDARVRLANAPAHAYDLIVLDAFSSDAIPTHLLTREALRLYRDKLADGGSLAFHISNRYIDLGPVLAALARDVGWNCRVRYDAEITPSEKQTGKLGSIWAVMAARESDLGPIASDPRWSPGRLQAGDRTWTDDYADLTAHLIVRQRPRKPSTE